MGNREGQEAYSQAGTGCPLPDVCSAGPGEKCELSRGHPRAEPHRDRRLQAEDEAALP